MDKLQLRLGHDIPTGMEISNFSNEMLPIASYAFSTQYWEDLNTITLGSAPGSTSSWSAIRSFSTGISLKVLNTDKIQVIRSVVNPSYDYQSMWRIRFQNPVTAENFYTSEINSFGASPFSFATSPYFQPATSWELVTLPQNNEYQVYFEARSRMVTTTSAGTAYIAARRLLLLPM
jgi:hypothetical protein